MTQQTIIADSQHASICIGALKRDVFALLHEAAEYNVTIQFQDAKLEVARVGTGIVNPGEYDKNGRSPQWTANLRAERDLLRQLVPGPWSASSSPAANSYQSAIRPIRPSYTCHCATLPPCSFFHPSRPYSIPITTTCTATTAAGHPCKNYTVKGTQLYKAHDAPTRTFAPSVISAKSAVQLPDDYSIEDANANLL